MRYDRARQNLDRHRTTSWPLRGVWDMTQTSGIAE